MRHYSGRGLAGLKSAETGDPARASRLRSRIAAERMIDMLSTADAALFGRRRAFPAAENLIIREAKRAGQATASVT